MSLNKTYWEAKKEFDRKFFWQALKENNFIQAKTAKMLGININCFSTKIRTLGLDKKIKEKTTRDRAEILLNDLKKGGYNYVKAGKILGVCHRNLNKKAKVLGLLKFVKELRQESIKLGRPAGWEWED